MATTTTTTRTTTAITTTGIEGPQGPQGLSLRSKRLRVVSEQRKTEEQDFRFWSRKKCNESQCHSFTCPIFPVIFDSHSFFFAPVWPGITSRPNNVATPRKVGQNHFFRDKTHFENNSKFHIIGRTQITPCFWHVMCHLVVLDGTRVACEQADFPQTRTSEPISLPEPVLLFSSGRGIPITLQKVHGLWERDCIRACMQTRTRVMHVHI